VPTPPPLANGAKKRASLSLDDATNPPATATGTIAVLSIINPVKVLVTAFAIERVAIGSITERAPFVHNRLLQHAVGRTLDPVPLRSTQAIAAGAGVDSGQKQNLGRVQVADSSHGRLVQQSDLDRPPAVPEPHPQLIGRDLKRVDSKFLIHSSS
jgi:hypothetical protein